MRDDGRMLASISYGLRTHRRLLCVMCTSVKLTLFTVLCGYVGG